MDLSICQASEDQFRDALELKRIYLEEVPVKSVVGSFSGLKEYEPGDPLNRIAWTSSLKWDGVSTYGLMVKEFEDTARKDILIALDYVETMRYGYGSEVMLEKAARAAVYLATVAASMSSFLRLLALGKPLVERRLYEPSDRQAFTAAIDTFCEERGQVDRAPSIRADVVALITSVWMPLRRARTLISSLKPRGTNLLVVAVDVERIAPSSEIRVAGGDVTEEDLERWERHRSLFLDIAKSITPHVVRYVGYRDLHTAVRELGEVLAWVEPI